MHANQFSAIRAGPPDVFIPDELPDAVFFNLPQIFHHTHPIFLSIPLIKVFQSPTGKGITGMVTVLPFALIAKA
jgi:hypothetical protein